MYYTVYKTTCLVNGKIYVGKHQTKNLNDGYLGSGKSLLRAVNKYGKENFKVERILLNNEDEMNELEAFIVDEDFISRKDTYNITLGGLGGFFYINSSGLNIVKNRYYSPEAKRKMSLANKGRKLSKEHKQKISQNNNYECPIRNKKISDKLTNRTFSEEHRANLSKSLINKRKTMGIVNKGKSLGSKYPETINLWHPIKNGSLTPFDVAYSIHKKFWWTCENNHSYERSPSTQIKCMKCPVCKTVGFKFPELAKLWHPIKNRDLTPFDVSYGSCKKVWWICDKGHEYEQRIDDKTLKGYGCPKCSGRK